VSLLTLIALTDETLELDAIMASAQGANAAGGIVIPVSSSAIKYLKFAPNVLIMPGLKGDLTVHFTDGDEVTYNNVAIDDAIRFAAASSVGTFYNEEVRGKW
jgi:hypothetical protein